VKGIEGHPWKRSAPSKPKDVDDKIDFGAMKGRRVSDLTGREAWYARNVILSNPELEPEWGDAVRSHMEVIGVDLRWREDTPVDVPFEIIDKYSLNFLGRFIQYYRKTIDNGDPQGFVTFIGLEIWRAFENYQSLKNPLFSTFRARCEGLIWTLRYTGAIIVPYDVEDGFALGPNIEDEEAILF